MKKTGKNHAFTLVEVLIYVAIFSLMAGGLLQFALIVNIWKTRTNFSINANDNMSGLEIFLRSELDKAQSVASPIPGDSANILSYYQNGEIRSIFLSQGRVYSSAHPEPLSDAGIVVSDLTFLNLGTAEADSLRYSFIVSPPAASSKEYSRPVHYQSAYSLD